MTQTVEGHPEAVPLPLPPEELLGIYRTLVLARALDQRIYDLAAAGRAASVVSCRDREGAQVGSAWALRAGHDAVLPLRQDTGVVLTLGMSPRDVVLGVLARADDPSSGGRQLPQLWGSAALNIVSGSALAGSHVPHAAGIALAAQLRGEDRVAACYLDDDAVAGAGFYETLEFAGARRLPVVYVWERVGSRASLPPPPGVAQVVVDGTQALDVHTATHAATTRARNGGGPTLIACEIAGDPLTALRYLLTERGLLAEADDRRITAEATAQVDAASHEGERAAAPLAGSASSHVFARPVGVGGEPSVAPPTGTEQTIVEALRRVQRELLAGDRRVTIVGRTATSGGIFRTTEGLLADVGDRRVVDVAVGSSALVGLGIGLAVAGMHPVVEMAMADAIHAAFDQIAGEAAKLHYRTNGAFEVPLVIRCPWGGGLRGGLYRSQAVEAFFAHVAGLKVVAPATPADAAGLLRAAVDDPDPVLFLEHKLLYRLVRGPVPDGEWRVPIGRADVARSGDDLTIVTYGLHRHLAVQAADALAADDVSVEVVDLRTISPLDTETVLDSVAKTSRLLIVHEDNVSFGVGAEVAAVVADQGFSDLDAPVRRLAMPDVPAMPFAASLEAALMIGADDIAAAARDLLAL